MLSCGYAFKSSPMEFTGRTLKHEREYTTRGFLGHHEEFKVIRDYQGLNVNKTFWLKSRLAPQ
jgi:hypothetical protein